MTHRDLPIRNGRRQRRRKGLSLLEIVLALALAAIAISLLSQLVSAGNRAAASARDRSKAVLVAQSVMAEYVAGIAEPVSTSAVWELDPMWSYDVAVSLNASSTIYIITVTATHNVESASPATFSLTQWLAIPPEPEEEEEEVDAI